MSSYDNMASHHYYTRREISQISRRSYAFGFCVGAVLAGVTVFCVCEFLTLRHYKKLLIEHGAAYYDARTGEFVVIRNDFAGQVR